MSNQDLEAIPNFLRLSDRLGTAGQPEQDQIAAIRQAGYEVVINLRSLDGILPDEQALVENEGMTYISIPIDWDTPTVENIEEVFAAMQANEGRRLFVHCALNMRVSACMYLYRVIREYIPPVQAIEDLHRIWTPNPTWQKLMDQVLSQQS